MLKPIRSKLAKRIVEGMEAGAELTKNQWAEELRTTPQKVSSSLSYLRKRGYLFYPLRPENRGEQGKIVSILKKTRYIQEITERHDKQYLMPHLESAFRIIELSLPKYPELEGEIRGRLEHLASLLSHEQRAVKQLTK